MAANTFGLELSFHTVCSNLKRKEDVLIVMAHWYLTKFGFRCIGIGDDTTLSGNESDSELLPTGWNGSETYALRYLFDKKLFILRGVRTDDILIINLLCTEDLNVSNLTLNVTETVKEMNGPVDKMVPSYLSLCERIRKELVEPVTKKISSEVSTQTSGENPRPSSPPYERSPLAVNPGAERSFPDPLNPFSYGRSDLDPLGIGGRSGGMVFDPFRGGRHDLPPGGLPRGRVPGARFDPIGPPGIGRHGRGFGPDPDHLPPPGYDDMFM